MSDFNGNSGKNYRIQGSPLASGGEGEIFNIIGMPDYVAKIFRYDKRTTERERKLSVMVSIRPNMIEQYSWPVDVLYENGKFAGYIMPKIQGKEKLRDIYVFDKRQGKPWSLYIAIAKNVAAAVHNVHEIHQVIGDLNPENILVNPNDGMVTLVDTDSYHISDSRRTYRCEVGMPEYVAPELQGVHFPSASLPTFTEETDRFSLAVLIFALLMNGAHPFACKIISGSSSKFQPIDNMQKGYCAFFSETCAGNMDVPKYAPTIDCLPDDIQKLFRRAFVSGRTNTSLRPSAEEWYYALERLEDNLKTCLKNNQHIYYYGVNNCPWCQVTKKMHTISQSAFSSSSISGSSTTVQKPSVYRPPTPQYQQQQQYVPSNYKFTPSNNAAQSTKRKNPVVTVLVIIGVIFGLSMLVSLVIPAGVAILSNNKNSNEHSTYSENSSYVNSSSISENSSYSQSSSTNDSVTKSESSSTSPTEKSEVKIVSYKNTEYNTTKSELENKKIIVDDPAYSYSWDIEAGRIISQSVSAGNSIYEGDTIHFTVSKGPEFNTVPSSCYQVVFVKSQGTSATMTLYELDNGLWYKKFSCASTVGQSGVGSNYGENKKVTPKGTFKIGVVLSAQRKTNKMEWQPSSTSTVIVEDTSSSYYNQIKDKSELASGTDYDPIGERLNNGVNNASIFIEHNGNGYSQHGVTKGAGSSITICGCYNAIAPTWGCIDISANDMDNLLTFLDSSNEPYIITQ